MHFFCFSQVKHLIKLYIANRELICTASQILFEAIEVYNNTESIKILFEHKVCHGGETEIANTFLSFSTKIGEIFLWKDSF